MRRNRLRHIALLLLLGLGSACGLGAQFSGTSPVSAPGLNVRPKLTTDPDILYPPHREIRIMQGDLLTISVYGVTPAYIDPERVSLDGSIRLHLLGAVKVEGMSLKEAEQAISARFEQAEMFHDAQVSVALTEAPGHVVTIFGALKGVVPVIGPRRLYDVLAASGGLPTNASSVLTIERPGVAEPIVVDIGSDPAHSAAANIPVFAGDTIAVGTVGQVFVVGAVNRPAAIPLSGSVPITVLQAVTAAGGTTYPAKNNDTKLIRTTANRRTVMTIPLDEIMKGKAEDVTLQSDDILMVPSSAIRTALKNGGVTTVVALALAAQSFTR